MKIPWLGISAFLVLAIGGFILGQQIRTGSSKAVSPTLQETADALALLTGEFTSTEGGFKIKFPVTPQKTIQKVERSWGTVPITINYAQDPSGVYLIGYSQGPTRATGPKELKLMYDDARDRTLAEAVGKLIAERDFYYDRNLGREITVELSNGTGILRFLLIGQRWFTISVFTPEGKGPLSKDDLPEFRKTADGFFDSFSVVADSQAKKAGKQ